MPIFKNIDSQSGQPKNIYVGQVVAINIANDGTAMSGYVDGASLTISAPPAGGVQAVGTIAVTGGVITGINITNPGAGYTTAPTVTAPTGTHAVLTAVIKQSRSSVVQNAEIVFADTDVELGATAGPANRLKGIRSPGWHRVKEKMQSDGSVRYLTEQLVFIRNTAAGAGDAKADDAVIGDTAISIGTQPANASVTAPAAASFTVVATGATGYQWQIQTGGTGAYTNITNGGVYTTATTATLNISNSTGLNGKRYRCQVTNASAQVNSKGALLTVA